MYTNAADYIYNETLVDWYIKNNIASARYPGGTPSAYWDWENPCGKMDCWSTDPDFDESEREDVREWISIEEYMDFVDATGIKPLVGVNYKCHGKFWLSEKDSLKKAEKQAKYVAIERGHTGAFYYIGNEDNIKNT